MLHLEEVIGTWRGVQTEIPDYEPEWECLSFARDGLHAREYLAHPGMKKGFVHWYRFSLTQVGAVFHGYRRGVAYPEVSLRRVGDLLEVVPEHGWVTQFRRVPPEAAGEISTYVDLETGRFRSPPVKKSQPT